MNFFQRFFRSILNRNPNAGNVGQAKASIPSGTIDHTAIEEGSNALNDFANNPVFADAVVDIKADIQKQKKSESQHLAAGKADHDQTNALLSAAQKLEGEANSLEQPVAADGNKKRSNVPFIVGGIVLILILAGVFIKFGLNLLPSTPTESTPTKSTPAKSPAAGLSGPRGGTLMAWVDGSTLVFIPDTGGQDNNGVKGFWITLNPISNYQFSLCVQAGKCKPPTDPTSLKDYNDPMKENLPVGIVGPDIVGPDHSAGYCEWLTGRAGTGAETVKFADGSVHSFNGGVFCVFDHPLPLPQFTKTSPYYDPSVPMEDMSLKILRTEQFCQNKQGSQTVDLQLDKDTSIVSYSGDGKTSCQTVNGNRVVCSGSPNTNPQVEVGLLCDGFTGARCQIGSTFDGASCSNNMHGAKTKGMDDWEMNPHGVLVPTSGVQLPNGGFLGPITHPMIVIHGVMVAESLPGNGAPSNGLPSNGSSGNGASTNGSGASINSGNVASCPQGFYFDNGAQGCASLGTLQTQCLDGYHFNNDTLTCEADKPNGNYPGCPTSQLLNPLTSQCDAISKMISPTSVMMYEALNISLPDCTVIHKGGGTCPAGQSWKCSGIKSITCGCK